VLVTIQLGLFVSFERMVTIMIDHAPANLWIVPLGTKCFEDLSLLDEANRYRTLSIEGVSLVDPILVSFAQWRMPDGGTSPALIIGSDLRTGGLLPWNPVEGSLDALSVPESVAVDVITICSFRKAAVASCKELTQRSCHTYELNPPTIDHLQAFA
jgi:putative ABC transport system permease protein